MKTPFLKIVFEKWFIFSTH